jgi:hypothetical protein
VTVIISASRRTDIPTFYAEWMVQRLRAGFCTVPNPFRPQQVTRVSLLPSDVDVIVFWTRNPRPLMRHLSAIDGFGIPYYFQFTVLGLPRELDAKAPPLEVALRTFQDLSKRLGSQRVIWRYDPIVFTEKTPVAYHKERFTAIARELAGSTNRVVVSIVDPYRKTERRMKALQNAGAAVTECSPEAFADLMRHLAATAAENQMEIVSCAEEIDLACYGIRPGRCIDHELIQRVFGREVSAAKDPSQRKACGCVLSRDIGMYDSCLFGCQYCYATGSFESAKENYGRHDPRSPSLIGWHDAPDSAEANHEPRSGSPP